MQSIRPKYYGVFICQRAQFWYYLLFGMKCSVKVKGSGSSWCLLSQDNDDKMQWAQFALQFSIKQLEMSGSFICCTSSDNSAYIWGTLRKDIIKRPLMLKKEVDLISCGWDHALVHSHGILYGLGNNSYKQLGINSTSDYLQTLTILQQTSIKSLIGGFRQSYYISQDNLLGCGQSKKYELGISSPNPLLWQVICQNINEKIKGQVIKLRCTKRCLFLLNDKQQLYVLGYNEQNCCNDAGKTYYSQPTLVFEHVLDFSCGWGHLIILNTKREVLSYGRNNLGQLGRQNQQPAIVLQLTQNQYTQCIVCGSQYTFVRTNKSNIYTWGWNQHSNLLNNPQQVISKPTIVKDVKCSRLWTYPAITIIQQQL